VGFYTAEILDKGVRKGFELVSLDGRRGLLSHVDVRGPQRVGRYGVDVAGFERFLDTLAWPAPGGGLVVIDEIGKMECLSPLFRETLLQSLDSPNRIIGSIALKGGPFIQGIKRRADVRLFHVSEENRDNLATLLTELFLEHTKDRV
jgi:nucleoside-triphosphatase